MSGRAVEAAGDVDTLLLDKTGTITLGNRQASEFIPADGVTERELAEAAQLASLADETPEGRSIVVLAKERFDLRERPEVAHGLEFVPFSAETRMSGVQTDGTSIRKGASDAIQAWVGARGGRLSDGPPGRGRRGGPLGRHPARRRARRAGPRRDPPEGRRQGGHDPALHRAAARWASAP